MNQLTKILDSDDEHEDQKNHGFFIRNGKFCTFEYRGDKSVLRELSNFVMAIEFHLANGTNNSKRIIKIQRHSGELCLIEVFSSEMKPDTFETILKSKGCTFLGSGYQLKKIFEKLMNEEKEALFISILGWNKEFSIYVFANAVYIQNKLIEVNEVGIIETDCKRFYLPAFGIVNSSSDEFETEKLYAFRAGELTFEQWASLFSIAFGSNGDIGILYLILLIHRDIVFNQIGFFPFLFLFGDFGTGKTSFVERLLSLFGRDIIGTPLNNATSIALSRLVSTRVNSLFYFKEFTSETEQKVQDFILNAYDGAGRTTGIKSNDNKTKTLPVRSGLIFDGNDLPTQKMAILSRMIVLNFEEINFGEEQKLAFEELKMAALSGFGKVLLEILSKREFFDMHFKDAFYENFLDLKTLKKNKFTDRTLTHIALLMTPAKILCNELAFPFKFTEVLHSIFENAENQNYLLKQNSSTSIFWESFSYWLKKETVIRFDNYNSKSAHFNIKPVDSNTGIIQIKFQTLYPLYVRYCRENNITFTDKSSLKMILTSKANPEFLSNHQKGRGAAYTDKNFGTCYQFKYDRSGDSIFLSEIEINL